MGWRRNVARKYTDPQLKVMLVLQKHGFRFESEKGFPLSEKRGDGIWADILLIKELIRIECDDPFFKKDMDPYLKKDERLLKIYSIRTIRLLNRKIMLKSGEKYVLDMLKEVM